MLQPIHYLVLGVLAIATLIWLYLYAWVLRRLEARHFSRYLELGRPGLLRRGGLSNQGRVFLFLWRSDFRALGDAPLTRACSFLQVGGVILVGLLSAAVVLFLDRRSYG